MTTQDTLRADAEAAEANVKYLTEEIERLEERIVDMRRKRDDARLARVEALAAADFLDNAGWHVERDAKGVVTVRVKDSADGGAG